MNEFTRSDGRNPDQLRPVTFQTNIAPHASGSVLIGFGDTRVICAASLDKRVPRWMQQQGQTGGWLTAEYSMLPYSTHQRKDRDISRGKLDGRTVEIQRLIGRSLRAVCDLQKLPGHTLWIDCDVLQADGGTRTAAITGAYIAARLAIRQWMHFSALKEDPFRDSVAAISAGIYQEQAILDLNYVEDRDATVDANVVMTGSGAFVEVQSSGEEAVYTNDQLQELLRLAGHGVQQLTALQADALQTA